MPIEVEAPDGTVVEFPDGTPRDKIRAVMSKRQAQVNVQPKGGVPILGDFARAFGQAKDELVADYQREVGKVNRGMPRNPIEAVQQVADDMLATPRMLATAVGAIPNAAQAAVVRPIARAAEVIPGTNAADNERIINTALMGARPAVAAPIPRAAPKAAAKPKPVSVDDLRTSKTAAYQAVDDAGVRYKPEAFDELATGIRDEASAAAISNMRHPKASSMLEDIEGMRGQAPTLTEVDQLRQVVRRDVANANDDAEAFFGRGFIRNIDDWLDAAGPDQAMSGDPIRGAEALREARDLNTRLRKVEAVQDAVERAQNRASSTGSGGNIDNAIRQELRRVMERSRNLTGDEREAMQQLIDGGSGQNLLRLVGKLSPSGNGLMAALNIGATAAKPEAAALGLAGMASKTAADSMTLRKVDEILQLMASGGSREALAAPSLMDGLSLPHPRAIAGVPVVAAPLLEKPADQARPRRGMIGSRRAKR